jgi:hypothetical protein
MQTLEAIENEANRCGVRYLSHSAGRAGLESAPPQPQIAPRGKYDNQIH